MRHTDSVPRLWTDTIEAHRSAVREAALDATAALVAAGALSSITMSEIAQRTGIGRATLYKYFPDVETILAALRERQADVYLARMTATRDQPGTPMQRLEAVLREFAAMSQQTDASDIAALLYWRGRELPADRDLHVLVRELIVQAAATGAVRTDVPANELSIHAIYALSAASRLPTDASAARLVAVTLDGLNPMHDGHRGRSGTAASQHCSTIDGDRRDRDECS